MNTDFKELFFSLIGGKPTTGGGQAAHHSVGAVAAKPGVAGQESRADVTQGLMDDRGGLFAKLTDAITKLTDSLKRKATGRKGIVTRAREFAAARTKPAPLGGVSFEKQDRLPRGRGIPPARPMESANQPKQGVLGRIFGRKDPPTAEESPWARARPTPRKRRHAWGDGRPADKSFLGPHGVAEQKSEDKRDKARSNSRRLPRVDKKRVAGLISAEKPPMPTGGAAGGGGKGMLAAAGKGPIVIAAVIAAVESFRQALMFAERNVEKLGELAAFSGEISLAVAQKQVQEFQLKRSMALNTSGTSAEMVKEMMAFRKEIQPIKEDVQNILNVLTILILKTTTAIVGIGKAAKGVIAAASPVAALVIDLLQGIAKDINDAKKKLNPDLPHGTNTLIDPDWFRTRLDDIRTPMKPLNPVP